MVDRLGKELSKLYCITSFDIDIKVFWVVGFFCTLLYIAYQKERKMYPNMYFYLKLEFLP